MVRIAVAALALAGAMSLAVPSMANEHHFFGGGHPVFRGGGHAFRGGGFIRGGQYFGPRFIGPAVAGIVIGGLVSGYINSVYGCWMFLGYDPSGQAYYAPVECE